ncbi:hypothetical protein IWW34DRAFT_736528 [Fusarium oxysporum f. sp. albedinis]|jgi:hypothetical protein|uniref:Coenzyme Q-binding protein COQ10 START domain-containing protein n=4 Tax=Fusarium oxysporum TaxID=5507 RepID=A0A8H6G9A9_FUSOX|nr:hypothetical protein FOXB_12551 [Fusarium oxysporum f. sp. conglutinans Fo5176]EXL66632.1 hypothetical protein FOPG_17212 [Fusarium oxysporum f. sp. conglutinans race 2 54008]KAF6513622.1 hypothetical protein HZS61_006947 [Fusarium oxysporum f. sp. conglutinans]KAH7468338.1 hypothetical protein FOMA001_g15545 [Fusarium oxysporum f. sp. matthiolae]KAI3580096.1 hypothetical protein IWW34DRAFT_736528 [Fusarium oxysporum f. sp. albedinis]KAI8398701.1 hypothetical protein FOFC_19923 [Fusarium ox
MSLSNGKITKGQPAVLGPPLPTPINGVNALSAFSISYSVMINAPALKCLEKLIDTNTWPYWNALTPRGAITKAPPITDQTTNDSELHEVISRPGYLYAGVDFTVDVHMNKNSKQRTNTAAETVDRVERFETDDGRLGYRVTWRYIGMPFFLSHNERIHEFIESVDPTSGEKVTEYIGWETYGGLAALIIKYTIYDRFRDSFQRWRDDFKAATETS